MEELSLMKKRIIIMILCLLLTVSCVPAVFAAGLPFTDVARTDWFYSDVEIAYNDSLINGKTSTKFAPNDNLTYAEAVKLAACMNQKYMLGSVSLQNGSPWYQSYVDYCKMNGIISKDYVWNANATRAGYMEIFANALPNLTEINSIADNSIPDVSMRHPQAAGIYKLYRAGILQGVDAQHNCNPASNIRRGEVAAILTRMMYASQRISFSMAGGELKVAVTPDSYAGASNTMTFEAKATGGKAPYDFQWFWRDDDHPTWIAFLSNSGGISFAGAASDTLTLTMTDAQRAKHVEICCAAGDAAGKVVTSNTVSIGFKASALKAVVTGGPEVCTKSTVTTLTCTVSGGTAPYKYQWYWAGPNGKYYDMSTYWSGNSTSETLTGYPDPRYSKQSQICLVTDKNGAEAWSNEFVFTVTDANDAGGELKITKDLPSTMTLQPEQSPSATGTVSGGKAPYTFTWYWYDPADGMHTWEYTVNEPSHTFEIWPKSGTRELYAVVTDANGKSVTSNTLKITIKS